MTKKRSWEILADENRKNFREKVKFGKFSTESEIFSETGGIWNRGGNASLPRGDGRPWIWGTVPTNPLSLRPWVLSSPISFPSSSSSNGCFIPYSKSTILDNRAVLVVGPKLWRSDLDVHSLMSFTSKRILGLISFNLHSRWKLASDFSYVHQILIRLFQWIMSVNLDFTPFDNGAISVIS